jgi:hypothetical protein
MTALPSQTRGDTFRYSFTLSDTWTGESFTGGVKFTIRLSAPSTSTVTDTDAVHQSASTGASPEITFVGNVGTIVIPAATTTAWVPRTYYWDLQGIVDASPDIVYTIDSGTIKVTYDITRSV